MATRINQPRTQRQRRRLAAADFFRRQQQKRIREAMAASIWTPSALFAQGQQGAWYEPKPQYLFQDSAGTTPVTADGDPVGLMLDRSKGLELGPELVTGHEEGFFSLGSDAGSLNPLSPGTVTTEWFSVTGGTYFRLNTNGTSSLCRIQIRDSEGAITYSENSAEATSIGRVLRTEEFAVEMRVYFSTGTDTATELSVRELPGNHATTPSGPTYPGLYYDGVNDFLDTGVERIGDTGLFAGPGESFFVAVRFRASPGSTGTLIGRASGVSSTRTFQAYIDGPDAIVIKVRGIGAYTSSQNVVSQSLLDDQWHVVWVQWDGNNVIGGYDFAPPATLESGEAEESAGQRITIGARTNGAGFFFNGDIAGTVIVDAAISEESRISVLSYLLEGPPPAPPGGPSEDGLSTEGVTISQDFDTGDYE